MTKQERIQLLAGFALMSNEDLKSLYVDDFYNCLGSEADEMVEYGYDKVDIIERRKYEKWHSEKTDLEEACLRARGINDPIGFGEGKWKKN